MEIGKFRSVLASAIDHLPKKFRKAMENIEIVVEEWPTTEELSSFKEREGLPEGKGDILLLGLYQGIPLPKRDPQFYTMVLPDKITLFRRSMETYCGNNEEMMRRQIEITLLHEIGHYFGMEDEELRKLGY